MTLDWFKFLPALLLLLIPGEFFNGKKTRYREVARDWRDYWRRAAIHGQHAIDLVRAALGMWLLFASLQGGVEALIVRGGIQALAVWLQTVVCRREGSGHAPFLFVIGMLLAGISPTAALFATALAIIVAWGSHFAVAFFPVLAIAHVGIGFWFKGRGVILDLIIAASAVMIPFFWSILFRKELVAAYRAKRQVGEPLSPLR